MRILICGLAVFLSSCAPPRILGSNENGVIVARGAGSEQEMVSVAEEHCNRFGRTAKPAMVSAGSSGASPVFLFDCVNP